MVPRSKPSWEATTPEARDGYAGHGHRQYKAHASNQRSTEMTDSQLDQALTRLAAWTIAVGMAVIAAALLARIGGR